jgi:glycosyltransferase involved in cell wall biosynthesis
VAALRIARKLGLPLMITARGSDISLIAQRGRSRAQVLEAMSLASENIAVCEALRQEMIRLGAAPERVHTIRNGVDLELFRPTGDREEIRRRWKVPAEAKLVVSVGALIERKGHHLTIDAVAQLPGVHLIIAGEGPERRPLERQIRALGIVDRVKLVGAIPHPELPSLYESADLSVLASSREGWANVVLESLACGTPVAATAIWGTPEIIHDDVAGELIAERNAAAIRKGIHSLLDKPRSRAEVRSYAEHFSWSESVSLVLDAATRAVRTNQKQEMAVSEGIIG